MNRKLLGNYGEDLARKEYERCGFTLVERQYHCRFGEIDLIFSKESCLYFVEVRTKTGTQYGLAEESITSKKIDTIRKVAQYYMQTKRLQQMDIQFDVVAIFISKQEKKAWVKRVAKAF